MSVSYFKINYMKLFKGQVQCLWLYHIKNLSILFT